MGSIIEKGEKVMTAAEARKLNKMAEEIRQTAATPRCQLGKPCEWLVPAGAGKALCGTVRCVDQDGWSVERA
ncbi:hypothetical protein [Tumebacillus lipolyticus]|uniref:Uncharacterized protein n=1 Tax=Tumebacillus lipolyticus TaxID=1280370 RepID=A0ABW4ZT43_9BACL